MRSLFLGVVLLAGVPVFGQDSGAFLGTALDHLQHARFDLAAAAFRQALTVDPKLVTAQYDLGVCYFAQGQFENARQSFEQTRKLVPRHHLAAYYLARIDLLQDRLPEAVAKFTELVREQPAADEYYYLGSAYFRQGNTDAAIESLKHAIDRNSSDQRAHFLIARAYQRAGRPKDAEQEFRLSSEIRATSQKAAQDITACESALRSVSKTEAMDGCKQLLDGTDPQNLVSLGVLFAQQGWIEEALPFFTRAAEFDPENYDAHFNLGLSYFNLKRYADARKPLSEALALRPEAFTPLALLGSASYVLGDDYQALQYLRHALKLEPQNEKVRGLLLNELGVVGRHAAEQGNFKEAADCLADSGNLSPASPDVQNIAFALSKDAGASGDYTDALRLLEISKLNKGALPEWHALKGYISYQSGDAITAVSELQRAIELEPANEDYVLQLSEVFVGNNSPEAAVALMGAACKTFARSARSWFSLGVAQLAADNLPVAETSLKHSLVLDPKLDVAWDVLAQGYRNAGRWQDLSDAATHLVAVNPQNERGYFYQAIALSRSNGDPATIRNLLEKACTLDSGDAEARYELAKLLVRSGDKDEALTHLEKLVAQTGDYPQAYYQLYRLYAEKGDTAKSREAEATFERLRLQRGRPVRKLQVKIREQ